MQTFYGTKRDGTGIHMAEADPTAEMRENE